MSSITDRINSDFIEAYKAKEELKTSTLRLIKSALKNAEISQKSELSDDDAIKIIKKEIKQRNDALLQYKSGGRDDLASKEQSEIKLLEVYVPAQLDDTAIEQIVAETIKELDANSKADFGRVMSAVMSKVSSRADGSAVSRIVSSKL